MKTPVSHRLLFAALLLFLCSGLAAAPRVVVSIPPLHSLVSALMADVAEPALLLEEIQIHSEALDPFQTSRILTADLVIWVGPGLETPLAEAAQRLPAVDRKMVTLSRYLPLLGHAAQSEPGFDRQRSRDLGSWTDPRLARMAIRHITPLLVRLDPAHQERYLDNEIELLERLAALEREIATRLAPFGPVPRQTFEGADRYFVHRFVPVDPDAATLHRVAGGARFGCQPAPAEASVAVAERYFQLLRGTDRGYAACLQRLEGARSAGEGRSAGGDPS